MGKRLLVMKEPGYVAFVVNLIVRSPVTEMPEAFHADEDRWR